MPFVTRSTSTRRSPCSAPPPEPAGRAAPDRGQAAVLFVIVVTALAAMMVSGLAAVGVAARDRVRAEAAADAAALAALGASGAGEAARVAAANGATLVSWATGPGPDEVTVVVRVGGASATARATDRP